MGGLSLSKPSTAGEGKENRAFRHNCPGDSCIQNRSAAAGLCLTPTVADRAAPVKKAKVGKKAQRAESDALAAVRSAKQSAKVDAVWELLKQGRTGVAVLHG